MLEHGYTNGTIAQKSSDMNGTDMQECGGEYVAVMQEKGIDKSIDSDMLPQQGHGDGDEALIPESGDASEVRMWDVTDVSYVLSDHEFAIMAVAVGMTSIYGLELDVDSLERDDVLEIVMQMVSKEMLVRKGDGFVPAEPYDRIFKTLRDCEEVLTIHHSSRHLPPKCVYFAEETWMTETDPYASSRIRCRKIIKSEIAQILRAQEYLPKLVRERDEIGGREVYTGEAGEPATGMYTEEEVRAWDEWEPSGDLMDMDVLFFNPECQMAMEKRRKTGEEYLPVRQLCVVRRPDGYQIEVYEDGRRRCMPYDFERFCLEAEAL